MAGTRPEIIKVAPIIREFMRLGLDLYFVLTGQHYDYFLSQQIIKDLELRKPDKSFELANSSPASQIAEIMTKLEKLLKNNRETVVIIQGDTNSVLSAALTAVKLRLPIAHVEAGLRSYDYAPTHEARKNLLNEGVFGRIHVTGNTVIDAVNQHLPLAQKKSKVLEKVRFSEYILATIHRSENVDSKKVLANIVQGFLRSKLPLLLPIHPRTRSRLVEFSFFEKLKSAKNIQLLSPQG